MMVKSAKASGPSIPPRRKSLSWDGSSQASFTFPRSHHLIVTTAKGVFAWGSHGVKRIFRSGSEGIVAAKKANNGSGLLAVADSQVVVLHDVNQGMQRSYRLKGSDGQVRLLRYAGDSKNLFFTTTLQTAVQIYSLNQSRLLDPSHDHPSPPTVFSLSPTSHLLLSASEAPPLIYLTNLALGTRPILIRPQCSSSALVAANFHPERPNIFTLAFADGSAAIYDAVQLFQDNGAGQRRLGPAGMGIGGEIASIKRLHAVGAWVSENEHLHEASTGTVNIGYKDFGITAAAFIPGFNATVVTVGADGKCCVVDFAKRGARCLNTWPLFAPATSLSILPSARRSPNGISQVDGAARSRGQSLNDERILIAIGCQDGKALLFDLTGNVRGEQSIDPSGTRVIDVEWLSGDGTSAHDLSKNREKSRQAVPLASTTHKNRRSLGSLLASGRPVFEEVITITDTSEPPLPETSLDSSTQQHLLPSRDRVILPAGPALSPLDLSSPIKPALGTEVLNGGSSIKTTKKTRGASVRVRRSGTPNIIERVSNDKQPRRPRTSSSRSSSAKVHSHPAVPPRPTPRKGGQLAAIRAETACLATADRADSKVTSNTRNMADKTSQPGKGLELFAPYMKQNLLANPQKPQTGPSTNTTMPRTFTNTKEPAEDPWTDIGSEPLQPSHEAPLEPSSATTKSYKTARSCLLNPSEASNDTVVTWSAGTSRQPTPSLYSEVAVTGLPSKAKKERKKGHISLSQTTESDDTIVQWKSFQRPPRALYIHEDLPLPEQAKTAPPSRLLPSIPGAFPTAPAPLGEASHNAQPPSSPSKPKASQPHSLQTNPPENSHCPCLEDHKSLLKSVQSDMVAFQKGMEKRFEKQNKTMEKRMTELEEGKVRLEGENRKLREELARERRRARGGL